MKKINIYYYCFVVLVNLCAALVGCSYHSRGYKMHCPSSSRKSLVDHSFFAQSNLDHGLEKSIDDLLKRLEECCQFIDKKRKNCDINYIIETSQTFQFKQNIETSQAFQFKQHKDNRRDPELISHNDTAFIYPDRLSDGETKAFEVLKSSFSAPLFLKMYYCFFWRKSSIERLKEIDFNQSMESSVGGQGLQAPNGKKAFGVLDYLHQDLVPYWREIVQLLLLHAFNTSIAQGEIDFKKAKKRYKIACEAVNNMYSLADIQACAKYFCTKVEKALCSPNKNSCNPIKNNCSPLQRIKKDGHMRFLNGLKQYILEPIEDGYDTLMDIVNHIQYEADAHIKEKVTDTIEMFYNIACSFGIIDLVFNLRHLVLVYRASIKQKETCLKKIGKEEMQLLTAKLYLARFIAGHFNFDFLKQKIRELLIM